MRELLEQDGREIEVTVEADVVALEISQDAEEREIGFSGGFVEPFRPLLVQVAENLLAFRSSSEMDVCSLPAHAMKQTQLLAGGLQRGELDPGAVRAETAYKPATA